MSIQRRLAAPQFGKPALNHALDCGVSDRYRWADKMGLDAAVYADDDCETQVISVRIGNIDAVARLRETIEEKSPEARVLLTKVLYSGSHCGDSLAVEEVASAKAELDQLAQRCGGDEFIEQFVSDFGHVLSTAITHGRPVTF